MDEVCRFCGLPTYLSVDKCPYCGEKYRSSREIADCGEKYGNRHKTTDCNLINLCTVNELRKLFGLKDI